MLGVSLASLLLALSTVASVRIVRGTKLVLRVGERRIEVSDAKDGAARAIDEVVEIVKATQAVTSRE